MAQPLKPTTSKFKEYASTYKKQSAKIVLRDFIDALETKVGQELLEDLMVMHSVLFNKLAMKLEVSPEEKIRYQVLTELLQNWAYRIHLYEQQIKMTEEERKHDL